MYFNSNLSYLRIKRQLTQTALGNEIDSSKQIICNYETGLREPSLTTVIKVAKYFNVMIDDLLTKDLRPAGAVLSSNIRHIRKANGLTQKEFASILGVEDPAVSKYESGDNKPTIESLVNISEFFGVSVDDLLKKDLSKGGF